MKLVSPGFAADGLNTLVLTQKFLPPLIAS
jgi:hypothetical protein